MARHKTDRPPLVERALMSVMGPADVGDPSAPVRVVEIDEDICPHCHRPYSSHPVVRDPVLGSMSECPGPSS